MPCCYEQQEHVQVGIVAEEFLDFSDLGQDLFLFCVVEFNYVFFVGEAVLSHGAFHGLAIILACLQIREGLAYGSYFLALLVFFDLHFGH